MRVGSAPSSAKAIRLVFAAVLVLYGLQLAFLARFGEPYPALMMPSFWGTSMNADGDMEAQGVEALVTFETGDPVTLTAPQLFAQAPSSHHTSMALRLLPRRRPPPRPRPEGGVRAAVDAVLPGLAIREAARFSSEASPGLAAWLRARLGQLFPERRPTRVAFAWYVDRFHFAGGPPEKERVALETIAVELPR